MRLQCARLRSLKGSRMARRAQGCFSLLFSRELFSKRPAFLCAGAELPSGTALLRNRTPLSYGREPPTPAPPSLLAYPTHLFVSKKFCCGVNPAGRCCSAIEAIRRLAPISLHAAT